METNQTLLRRVTQSTATLRKVYLTRVLLLMAGLLSLSLISQAQTSVTTTLASRSKCPGDTVWVSVYVQNLVNCSAGSLEFKFSTSVLTPTSIGQTDAPTIGYRNKSTQITSMWLVNAHNDTVTIGFFNLSTPINIANGLLCQLLFTVKNNNGYSPLTWNLGVDSAACMYSDFNDPFGPALPAVWVNGNVHTSPSILDQPTNLTLTPGGTGSFTLTAVEATSYEWQVSTDGGVIYNTISAGAPYSGENTSTLTITNATVSMSGNKYRCRIGGNCNSPYNYMNSNTASLTVSIPCPSVFEVTGDGSYCPGTQGREVFLSGSEIGVFYQLKRNGTPIGSPVAGTGAPLNFGYQTIVTSPSTFTAEGTNTCGTTQMSGDAVVSTYGLPIGILNPPSPNPTICSGQGTYFYVQLSGPAGYLPCTVTYKDETNNLYPSVILTGSNNQVQIFPTASHTYTLYSIVDNHGCNATNMSGSATINVNPAPNPTIGSNSPICEGQDLQLNAFAAGTVTYLWTHQGESGWNSTQQNPIRPAALQSYSGIYNCSVTNSSNGCSKTVTTQVTVNPPMPGQPGAITGPSHVCKGQNGIVYSIGTITNATSYVWSVPIGFTIISGQGTQTLTVNIGANATSDYVTVAGNNGCGTGPSSQLMVTSHEMPTVTWSTTLTSQCVSATTYTLTGGSPAGGTYSGPGVSGTNFNASLAGVGTHTLTYAYSDPYGCSGSITNTITVCALPVVTWNNTLTNQCISSTFYLLTGASPAGGTYSGPGVSGSVFNASLAGTGVKTLTYTYVDPGCNCTNSVTNTITVNPLPTVTWSNALTPQCANATTYTLTGGSPGGGVYSGTGVSGTNFNASVAGVGVKTLTYTYTDLNGCTNSASNSITVNALPNVTWENALTPQCINNTTYELTGGSPAGGSYAGIGVTGTNFNASVAGTGLKTLTYTYQNANGCSSSANNTILVYNNPVANAGEDQTLNIGQSTTLTGTGSGGTGVYTYLWTPAEFLVDNTVQNPSTVALTSTVTFTLVVTDNISGCQSLADQITVTVANYPLSINVTAFPQNICAGGLTHLSAGAAGGTGDYTYSWTSLPEGFTSNAVAPIVYPTETTTYYVTVSDGITSESGSVTVNVTPLPEIFTVSGGGAYCAGDAGLFINLDGSQEGITYILRLNGEYVTSVTGTGAALTFGPYTAGGDYTVVASVPEMGCISAMTGMATISVNPNPVIFSLSAGDPICAEGGAIQISLSGSQTDVDYQLFYQDIPLGTPVAGNGGTLVLATVTESGLYSCVATNANTLCTSTMSNTVDVNYIPLPEVFNVGGGGTFCTGGEAAVTLDGSQTGVSYHLLRNGQETAIAQGTGSELLFGPFVVPGEYSIFAQNNITNCTVLMNGTATITINPLPVAHAGDDQTIAYGTSATLAGSATGGNAEVLAYHWEPATLLVDADVQNPVTVNLTTEADFTLVVTNTETGCISGPDMVHVGITGGPLAISVYGNPDVICAGGTASIELMIENGTGNYTVNWTSVPEGFTSSATYLEVSPLETTTYYVVVSDGIDTQNGEFTVTVNPLPEVFTVSGGGAACAGTEGFNIDLSGSQTGVNYYIELNGEFFEGPIAGTDEPMSFGLYDLPGIYTIYAVNNDCQSEMEGAAEIIIHELPVVVANPVNLTVQEGNSGQFTVTADFTTNYQWQVSTNGIDFTDLTDNAVYSGVNTQQLTITGATLDMDGNHYRCYLTNEFCETYSGSALLTVYPYVEMITASLGAYTVCPGELVIPIHVANMTNVASVSLSFNFNPTVLTYLSYNNINPAVNDPAMVSINAVNGSLVFSHYTLSPYSILDGDLVNLVFNYTGGNSTLNFNLGAPENNQFTDLEGTVLNAEFINGSVSPLAAAAVFISHPADVTVNSGDNATFHVTATGASGYQWIVKNGSLWENLMDDAIYSGTQTPDLLITGTTLSMSGNEYKCVITEEICGLTATSSAATLTVNPVSEQIITTVGNATACPGSQIIVPVTVNQMSGVSAISLTLGWDPSVLTYVTSQNINPAFPNPGEIIFNASAGNWAMSWYSITPMTILSGTLVDLVFDYHGGATDLTWNLAVTGACEYNDPDGNILPATFANGHVDGYAGPSILAQPADVSIYDGSNATFTVNAENAASYAWYVSTDNGASWTALTDGGVYSGTQTGTLQITGADISFNGYLFHCVLTSEMCEVTSYNAELTVLPIVQGIITTAGTATACTNSQVVIPVSVQYFYNVSAISLVLNYDQDVLTYVGSQNINPVFNPPLDGMIINSYPGYWGLSWYNIAPVNISDGNIIELIFNYNGGSTNLEWNLVTQGYCEYNDPDGNILAASFMNGFVGPAGDNPVITQQPADVNISDLGNASFTVIATGASGYQWQVSENGGGLWNDVVDGGVYSGATTNTLDLTTVPITMDDYLFRCVVSGGQCNVVSDHALLNVVPLGGIIETTLPDLVACQGSQIIVPVTVQYLYNIAAMSLTLNYDPTVLTFIGSQNVNPQLESGSLNEFQFDGEWRMSWYSITPVNIGTGTILELVFNYNGGITDLTWNVTTPGYCEYNDFDGNILLANFTNGSVGPNGIVPTITSNPADITVPHHGNALFSVTATDATAYQWQVSTDGGNTWNYLTDNAVYSGALTNELTITNAIYLYNGYQYRCMVTGEICEIASAFATLTVTPIEFNIVTTATSSAECPGNDVIVPVTVTDLYNVASISMALNYDESVLSYMGYQNLNPAISDAILNEGSGIFMLSWYSVIPLSLGDATLFELVFHYNGGVGNMNWDLVTPGFCEYTNLDGDVLASTFVSGAITSSEVTPVIVANPAETGGFVGDPVSFTASAADYVSLQWQFSNDGGLTWNDVVDNGNITGSTTETLSIAHLELEMNGYLFRLTALGTCGHVASSESALLTVILQPTIVTTVGSLSQCAGDFIVPVTATNFMNVAAMSLTLNFDDAQFSYVGFQNVNPEFTNGIISINNSGNQIIVGYASLVPTTIADGNLFEIILHSNGGTTNLNWDVVTPGACEYQTIQSYVIPSAFVDGSLTAIELPTYTFEVSATEVCYGQPVTFFDHFTGVAPWTVSMTKNGIPNTFTVYNAENVYTEDYTETAIIEMLSVTDGNGCTNAVNQSVTITVNPLPTYTTTVSPTTICPGETVEFTNYFTGTAPWTVTMTVNGVPGSFTVNTPSELYTEAYNETTVYELLTVTDGNGCTNDVNLNVTITVNPVTSITSQPTSVSMDEGTGTSFHVVAENATSYQWQISTDNGATWTDLTESENYSGVQTADLNIALVDYFMNGNQYQCIVGGLCPESITSDAATLTVYPVIITIAGTVEQCVGDVIVPISVIHMYGMAAMSLTLNYDPDVLTYVGYQDVNNEFNNGYLAIDATGSQVKMGYFSITPADLGDALLFNIVFSSNGGYSELTWDTETLGNCEYQNLAGDPITSVYINGSVTVNPLPTATAINDQLTICYGQSTTLGYTLTGTAPWTLEITSQSASGSPVVSTVEVTTNPYEFEVSPLETTTWTINSLTDANGCSSAVNIPVTVVVNELPNATLSVDHSTICAGDPVTLTVTFTAGLAPYTLVLNNQGVNETHIVNNSTFEITYIPDGAVANYSIVSITDNNNCYAAPEASVTVTVNPLPVVTLDPAGPFCNDASPVVLNGQPVGGVYSGEGVIDGQFNPGLVEPGSYVITYTYTNENNCVNSASQTIVVNALPTNYLVIGGGPYCAGGNGVIVGMSGSELGIQYQLYKDGVYTGQMIMGNGSVINFGSLTQAGDYTVLATNLLTGCEAWMEGNALVTVNPVPNVYAGGYSIICQGTSTTLNAVVTGGTQPFNYQWSPANGLNNATILNPVASPSGTTFYTLLVTDANGCTDSDNALVVVNPKPVVNAGVDKTILAGGSVVMTASVSGGQAPYTYSWTPATGLSNANILNPVASPAVTTTYTLNVTDHRGCTNSDQVVINVTNVPLGYDVTGFVTYDNDVNTPLNNTTVTLNSGATLVGTTLTTGTGEYVFTPIANGNYTTHGTSTKPWGGGNALDALLISRHFVNLQPLSGLRLLAADCDNNGVVNAADGLLVMLRSVLMINAFPAGDWIFETKTFDVNNGTVNNNFKGLCFGDVNGSYIPAAKFGPAIMLDINGTQAIETNQQFNLPIYAAKDMSVGAVSLVLDIPSGIDIVAVKPADALKSANFIYNIVDGKLYIEWFTLNTLEMKDGDILFNMTATTNKFADTKEFVFNVDGESVMGDPTARIIEGAMIRIPKVKILEGTFDLSTNYPNPFGYSTDISYTLPESGKVTLVIYNAIGDVVANVINEEQNAGNYLIRFDGSKLEQGVYFYRMVVNGINHKYEGVRRMIISR